MLFLYGIHLFEYFLSGIAVSDICLLGLLVYVVVQKKKDVASLSEGVDRRVLTGWVVFAAIAGVSGLLNSGSSYFSAQRFLMSYGKLWLYGISLVLIPPFLAGRTEQLSSILARSIVMIGVAGLYQWAAHHFAPGLPYSLTHELISPRPGIEAMVSYPGQFRIKSVYSEPAHLAVYLNLLYAYFLHNRIRLKAWIHGLTIAVIIMTYSLAGLALLVMNIFFALLKAEWVRREKWKVAGGTMLAGVLAAQHPFIRRRVLEVIRFRDMSALERLFGGFEIAQSFPWYGVGMGQLQTFYSTIEHQLVFSHGWQVHNVIPAVLAAGGWAGLLAFTFFLFQMSRKTPVLILFFCVSLFAWGFFNATPFWFFLILAETAGRTVTPSTILPSHERQIP